MTDNLTNLISQAVVATMTPEFVEREVKTRVERLITESINSALRSYSDTGKLIEKAVQDAIKVERLDLPSYGLMVHDMLKNQIEALVSPLIAGRLAEDMAELLKLAPKEVTLSSIVAGMVNARKEDGAYGPDLVTCIIEEGNYDNTWVYLDEHNSYAPHDKYQCDYRLMLDKDGRIFSATMRGTEYNSGKPNKTVIGRSYGLEQKFRAMIACNTQIIIDENEISTGWED